MKGVDKVHLRWFLCFQTTIAAVIQIFYFTDVSMPAEVNYDKCTQDTYKQFYNTKPKHLYKTNIQNPV